jgi:hypothetical protein
MIAIGSGYAAGYDLVYWVSRRALTEPGSTAAKPGLMKNGSVGARYL